MTQHSKIFSDLYAIINFCEWKPSFGTYCQIAGETLYWPNKLALSTYSNRRTFGTMSLLSANSLGIQRMMLKVLWQQPDNSTAKVRHLLQKQLKSFKETLWISSWTSSSGFYLHRWREFDFEPKETIWKRAKSSRRFSCQDRWWGLPWHFQETKWPQGSDIG